MLLLAGVACGPIRAADFGTPTPIPKLKPAEVVLDTGRKYGVVASGIGAAVHPAPDPTTPTMTTLRFTQIVATTGDASGADGKPWRRLADGGWVSRDAILLFDTVHEAMSLATELRVFSGPDVRRPGGQAPVRPLLPPPGRTPSPSGARAAGTATPTPTVTATPTVTRTPTPSPRPTGSVTAGPAAPQPLYGVVLRDDVHQFRSPGVQPADRATLDAGTAVAVVEDAVGPDGQHYLRTDEGVWLPAGGVRTFATLPEMTEFAYQLTMTALAPGADVDPSVQPALWLVHREPEFRYLADAIGQYKVPVRVGTLAQGLIGAYSFNDRSITISSQFADGDERLVAVALAHEATHAWEAGQGLRINTISDCFEAELRAFKNQAALWEKFYGPNGKDKPATAAEADQNEVLRLVKQDPEGLKSRLVGRYADECGYKGPLPAAGTPAPGTPAPSTPSAQAKPTAATKPGGP